MQLKIDSLVDWIVSSEEAGVEKPHPYIFHLALRKMGLDQKEVLMIGDSQQKDILGSKLLNIRYYHIDI
jgi:putative hydrolase of the HAD superfamily